MLDKKFAMDVNQVCPQCNKIGHINRNNNENETHVHLFKLTNMVRSLTETLTNGEEIRAYSIKFRMYTKLLLMTYARVEFDFPVFSEEQ